MAGGAQGTGGRGFPLPLAGEGGAQRRVRARADIARELRRNETNPERLLWHHLRNRRLDGHKFVRQIPIGPYFADFACREAGLVIEIDGAQHTSETDAVRTKHLGSEGYAVLRFWNHEVLDGIETVVETISLVLKGRPSHGLRFAPATLSHAWEREPAPHPQSVPSLMPGGGWRAAPGEGLSLSPKRDE